MYTEGPKNGTVMQLFNNLHRTKNNNNYYSVPIKIFL